MNEVGVIIIPELEGELADYHPRNRLWSEYDIAVLRNYYGRVPVEKIAGVLGRTPDSVRKKATSLGLTGALA